MSNGDGNFVVDGMEGDQYQNYDQMNMNDINESQLEERPLVQFKNGATYAG